MTIVHHEGAVAMATVENKSGSDPKAIGLANATIKPDRSDRDPQNLSKQNL